MTFPIDLAPILKRFDEIERKACILHDWYCRFPYDRGYVEYVKKQEDAYSAGMEQL